VIVAYSIYSQTLITIVYNVKKKLLLDSKNQPESETVPSEYISEAATPPLPQYVFVTKCLIKHR
jgi:hypothetical protein